jgi:membrane protease YdiL (CAAX protease family)
MREPDLRDAAWVLMLSLAGRLAVLLLSGMGAPDIAVIGVLQASFLAAPLVVARASRLDPLAANGLVRPRPLQVALVLLASLASLWLLFGLTRLQTELFRSLGYGKQAEVEEELLRRTIEITPAQYPLRTLLVFAVIPPICEEMFFRGILFRGIASRFGAAAALAGTTLLFSAVHSTLGQKGMMLFLGCYFGLLVYWTGSLWTSMLAHAVNNGAVIVMTWTYGTRLIDMPIPWGMTAISAVLFVLATTGLALDKRAPRAAT